MDHVVRHMVIASSIGSAKLVLHISTRAESGRGVLDAVAIAASPLLDPVRNRGQTFAVVRAASIRYLGIGVAVELHDWYAGSAWVAGQRDCGRITVGVGDIWLESARVRCEGCEEV